MRLLMLDDDPVEFLPDRAIDDHNDVRGRTRLVPQRLQRSIELVGDDAVVDGHENREVSDGGHVSLEPWELQGVWTVFFGGGRRHWMRVVLFHRKSLRYG